MRWDANRPQILDVRGIKERNFGGIKEQKTYAFLILECDFLGVTMVYNMSHDTFDLFGVQTWPHEYINSIHAVQSNLPNKQITAVSCCLVSLWKGTRSRNRTKGTKGTFIDLK